jgi:hypothetical protein
MNGQIVIWDLQDWIKVRRYMDNHKNILKALKRGLEPIASAVITHGSKFCSFPYNAPQITVNYTICLGI